MTKTMDQLKLQMKSVFGYDTFRMGQEEIIERVLQGEDVLGILPTGIGKSLCYQLPALVLDGVTIVVSPLVSLMIDQVKQLKVKGFKRVAAIHSLLTIREKKTILNHLSQYQLIYCSPEMLQNEHFFQQLKKRKISLFVVDEAHCISQWGQEFRTDYLKLHSRLVELQNPTVLALSATATPQVQADICHFLERPNMTKLVYNMDKPNIVFAVEKMVNETEKLERIIALLKDRPVPTMIYFSSRKVSERICIALNKELPELRIAYYHGGMDGDDRLAIQQQFMNDQLDVVCCTSAFGMGIDKQDIRFIIHYHLPTQMESFIQEVGRAGRDGKESVSLVLYAEGDEQIPLSLIEQELPNKSQIQKAFQYLTLEKVANKPIIEVKDVFVDSLQLNETQWRFLQYQLERHKLVRDEKVQLKNVDVHAAFHNIMDQQTRRLRYKMKKLFTFLDWMKQTGCRRNRLYLSFQKGFEKPIFSCCDQCDFLFENWKPEYNEREQEVLGWVPILKQLFHQEGGG